MPRLEKYSRIIGYNFGADGAGNNRIYEGTFRAKDGRLGYVFGYYDRAGKRIYTEVLTYAGFRSVIDSYAWPRS